MSSLQGELAAANSERGRLEAALSREVSSLNRLELEAQRGERELLQLVKASADERVRACVLVAVPAWPQSSNSTQRR